MGALRGPARRRQAMTEEQQECVHPPKAVKNYGNQYGSGTKCSLCNLKISWVPRRVMSSSTASAGPKIAAREAAASSTQGNGEETRDKSGDDHKVQVLTANVEALMNQVQQLTQAVTHTIQRQEQHGVQQQQFQANLQNLLPAMQNQAALAAQQAAHQVAQREWAALSRAGAVQGQAATAATAAEGVVSDGGDISDMEEPAWDQGWEYPEDQP